ncbi:hypothetical protein HDU97_004501, partial [Phlyctochytrium planicorne]
MVAAASGILIIALQVTCTVAQYSSYAVSRAAVYYTNRGDNSIFFAKRDGQKQSDPVQIPGTLIDVALYGPGPRLCGIGPAGNFFIYNDALPPSAADLGSKWVGEFWPADGRKLARASGSLNGQHIWARSSFPTDSSHTDLVEWVGINIFHVADDVTRMIKEVHVREAVYILTNNNQVCVRNFDASSARIMLCASTPFQGRFIAAGDAFLYVLSEEGALMATKKPLNVNSVFYETGFSAPGATFLGMPIDYDNVFVLDENGRPNESICTTPNVDCRPEGPKAQQTNENTLTTSIRQPTETLSGVPLSSSSTIMSGTATTNSVSQISNLTQTSAVSAVVPTLSTAPALLQLPASTPTAVGASGNATSSSSQDGGSSQGLSTGILAGFLGAAVIIISGKWCPNSPLHFLVIFANPALGAGVQPGRKDL